MADEQEEPRRIPVDLVLKTYVHRLRDDTLYKVMADFPAPTPGILKDQNIRETMLGKEAKETLTRLARDRDPEEYRIAVSEVRQDTKE